MTSPPPTDPDLDAVPDDVEDESPHGLRRHTTAERERLDRAYFDLEYDDPRNPQLRDRFERIDARLAELAVESAEARGQAARSIVTAKDAKEMAAKGETWLRRGVRLLGIVAGLSGAAFAWALTYARSDGDARATARERETERKWLVDTVRSLTMSDAAIRARLDAMDATLRLYFPIGAIRPHGPPREPSQDPPP